MTTAGWIFMLCSLGFVVGLISFCFAKILSRPSAANHMSAPSEIDTPDIGT